MSFVKDKLLKEPQPVFTGGTLCLMALLMQIYAVQITSDGRLVGYFNIPTVLYATLQNYSLLDFSIWIAQTVAPIAMVLLAMLIGKKRASLLAIPSAIPALTLVFALILGEGFSGYWLSYVAYFISAIVYALVATGVIKSLTPFRIYTAVVCLGAVALSVLDLPPFTLFDGSLFASSLVYFVFYHLAVFNFSKALPIQRAKKG